MKILHILPYSPLPPSFGGALRIYNLLRHMVTRHDVTVLYIGRGGSDADLAREFNGRIGKIVRIERPWSRDFRRINQLLSLFSRKSHFNRLGYSPAMEDALNRELASAPYDIVQTEFSHMASYTLVTDAVRILDAHNVEFDLHRRQGEQAGSMLRKFHYLDEARKIRLEELEAWGRQDLIFTTSERDRDLINADCPGVAKIVLPNGVDSGYFSPAGGQTEPDTLVFTGVMKYLPNSDGMRWFLADILPLVRASVPGVKVTVVGSDPPPDLQRFAGNGVTLTGRVDDVRPYVDRAAVSIVPLRMGGGTRLKIVEAFAMKKPVVSTTLGAEGIDVAHGESILLADEPRAFAEAVVSLLRDAKLRAKLAGNAFDLMMERYEWSVVAGILERGYAAALEGRKRGAVGERGRATAGGGR